MSDSKIYLSSEVFAKLSAIKGIKGKKWMGNSIRRKISKENFYFSFSTIHLSAGSRETRRRIKEMDGQLYVGEKYLREGKISFFKR